MFIACSTAIYFSLWISIRCDLMRKVHTWYRCVYLWAPVERRMRQTNQTIYWNITTMCVCVSYIQSVIMLNEMLDVGEENEMLFRGKNWRKLEKESERRNEIKQKKTVYKINIYRQTRTCMLCLNNKCTFPSLSLSLHVTSYSCRCMSIAWKWIRFNMRLFVIHSLPIGCLKWMYALTVFGSLYISISCDCHSVHFEMDSYMPLCT